MKEEESKARQEDAAKAGEAAGAAPRDQAAVQDRAAPGGAPREKTPEEVAGEIISQFKESDAASPDPAKAGKSAEAQAAKSGAGKPADESGQEKQEEKDASAKGDPAQAGEPAKDAEKAEAGKKAEAEKKDGAAKGPSGLKSVFASAQERFRRKRPEQQKSKGAGAPAKPQGKASEALSKALAAARSRLNPQGIRELARDKSNVAVALGAVAVLLSAAALLRSGSGGKDLDNAFVQASFEAGKAAETAAAPERAGAAASLTGNDDSDALDPKEQKPKQLVIKDLDEFNRMVGAAVDAKRMEEARKALEQRESKWQAAGETVPGGQKIYGNPKARFMLVEYSDIECPYCKNFFDVPKRVADLSNGQVAVEWRNFPLDFHQPAAGREAIAAQCVYEQKGNRAFWVALERLFETTGSNGQGSPILPSLASEMALDSGKYLECINSKDTARRIAKDQEAGAKDGVSSTPSVLIIDRSNGRTQLLPGAVPAEQIMQAVEAMNAQGNGPDADDRDETQGSAPSGASAATEVGVAPAK